MFNYFEPIKSQQIDEEEGIEAFEADSSDYYGEQEIDSTHVDSCFSDNFDTSLYVKVPREDLYHCWVTNLINPYEVDLTTKKDSTFIDCTGYIPPIVNKINSDFGFRRWRFHYGIDIDLNVGDTVRSAFDGMVRMATRGKRFGYYIVIRHNNGLETVYGHLKKNLVVPHQFVKAGDAIALGGNTGRSTGPHLHLEFRYLGQPINPNDLVDFTSESQKMRSDTFLLTKHTYNYVLEIRKIRYHVVRKGETLSHIAYRYGISVNQLCKLNKISRRKIIRPGQRIRYT